ncbi:MAG: hydantoinase/oxoprolinase family protein, partial [Salinarimonas sp.]
RQAGAFCAMGLLQSDVRQDYIQVFMRDLDGDVAQAALDGFAQLRARASDTLTREGFTGEQAAYRRALDLRYRGQQWDLRVELPNGDAFDPALVRRLFEAEYERQFGHIQPGGAIQITSLRMAGFGLLPPLEATPAPPSKDSPQRRATRRVWFADGWRDTAIFEGSDLAPGQALAGPAIVSEQTMTAIVRAGDTLEVDAAGNFIIDLAERRAKA